VLSCVDEYVILTTTTFKVVQRGQKGLYDTSNFLLRNFSPTVL